MAGGAFPGDRKPIEAGVDGPKKKSTIKVQHQGWKATVGGGFEHQFYDNVRLDELEKK